MLHQSVLAQAAFSPAVYSRPISIEGSVFAQLLISARASLDHDLDAAHRALDGMAALFDQSSQNTRGHDVLLPMVKVADRDTGTIRGGLAPWQLRRVVAHIDQHLSGQILVDGLAAIARLSGGHFCRAFKASTGETPHNYLVRQRIRRAQTLMLNTNDTLCQIAFECGLTDQAHLTRLFRKFTGDTPLTWRRTWQNA